ncbi:zinc-ribbon domain-containing protein [Arthrobacter sp. H14-L1]|nr:zinc-ribbon domain-containing protein [Arthrobacter sp. H14-L1]
MSATKGEPKVCAKCGANNNANSTTCIGCGTSI